MGIKALGSDIDPQMVTGCKENLEHFGLEGEIEVSDIGNVQNIFNKVTTIATDPPYGRSTTTNREELLSLYDRMLCTISEILDEGQVCGIVLPLECPTQRYSLQIREAHFQRVHKSLTRHYYLLQR